MAWKEIVHAVCAQVSGFSGEPALSESPEPGEATGADGTGRVLGHESAVGGACGHLLPEVVTSHGSCISAWVALSPVHAFWVFGEHVPFSKL